MRDGAGTAFLAGLLLVGVLEAGDDPVNHAKVGVKFGIGLVMLVLVMANMRKAHDPAGPLGRAAGAERCSNIGGRGLLVPGPRVSRAPVSGRPPVGLGGP